MSADPLARVGLGTAALAGLFEETDAATAGAALDRAWERGVRYFDTAPSYGSGLAETRLGEALRNRPRNEFVVSTKVGKLLRPGSPEPIFKGAPALEPFVDLSTEGVHRSLTESLERLGLDHVDIAFVHDPDENVEQGIAVVDALRAMGVSPGVGTKSVATALAFARHAAIDQLMLAGRYTPLDASAGESLLALCAARGIDVTVAGIFNSGLLCGGTTYEYRQAPGPLVRRAEKLAALCARHGVPLAALAIQFPLRNPAVARIVLGARNVTELDEDIDLLNHPIPDELWRDELVPQL